MPEGATSEKPLRFALLIRVSTEKQEKRGESLRTQERDLTAAVERLGGKIAKIYKGQESGMSGHERELFQQLLKDAARKPRQFDAVMVHDASRWTRDNVDNETGLDHLREHDIRFFVQAMEFSLFDPTQRFVLASQATFNKLSTLLRLQKSITSCIDRAKRINAPTAGKIPFGRIWDKKSETWSIDEKKHAAIKDIAKRYLAGESLPALAKEYGMNHANLHKTLTKRCGDKHSIRFKKEELNIDETVVITVPRLLPETTIKAILRRAEANKTYQHGRPKHDYLLSGYIFCGHCGYSMFGQMNHGVRRYYRHAHTERTKECPIHDPRPWVRADTVEFQVISKLFEMFGNPALLERAIERATPNREKIEEIRKQIDRINRELATKERARNTILNLIERGSLTEDQAGAKLDDIKEKESQLQETRRRLEATIAHVPTPEAIKLYVQRDGNSVLVYDDDGVSYTGGNDVETWSQMWRSERRHEEFLALVKHAFSGPLPSGDPAGVYVYQHGNSRPHRPKSWKLVIRGSLGGETELVVPHASRSPARVPHGCRSLLIRPPPAA